MPVDIATQMKCPREKQDPTIRIRMYLEKRDLWNETKLNEMQAEAEKMIADIVKRAEGIAEPVCNDMFDSMYASISDNSKAQRHA